MSYPFTVNGKTRLAGAPNGPEFWRIDDLSEERTGIDFLNNPAALVRGPHALAERVCEAMNVFGRQARETGAGPGRDS